MLRYLVNTSVLNAPRPLDVELLSSHPTAEHERDLRSEVAGTRARELFDNEGAIYELQDPEEHTARRCLEVLIEGDL